MGEGKAMPDALRVGRMVRPDVRGADGLVNPLAAGESGVASGPGVLRSVPPGVAVAGSADDGV